MNQAVIIMTTTETRQEAIQIGNQMIRDERCACVQILPQMTSIYKWKGDIQNAEEFLVLFKTVQSKTQDLMQSIKKIHSYETPEIIAVDAASVDSDYLKWLQAHTSPDISI
ncbi:MAG: divalent-cation tolerance protein CutA [Candidatus Marinimicrobia bacterium]|nr:divalent-cation tolerance protein CutA [Candidatus Neomarinimicrobiota bacterium]MCF7851223.1 divalent-cation tolerance protein CutA [Candidatus Neomarinimicrobiota bacterium]